MREDHEAEDATPLRRALAAEREALGEVRQARAEARSIVADARSRARAIERRASDRIARVVRAAEDQTQRLLEQEQEQERAALEALEQVPDAGELLEAAASAVARRLTGDDTLAGERSADPADD